MAYSAGIIGAGGIAGLGILGLHDEEDIGRKKFQESHTGGHVSIPLDRPLRDVTITSW
jgi:hypothetical protein